MGEWKNGHFHGYGELKYSNGVVYKVKRAKEQVLVHPILSQTIGDKELNLSKLS